MSFDGGGDSRMEGTIKLEIPSLSILDGKVKSVPQMIADLPWHLVAEAEYSHRGNETFLSMFAHCNPDSDSTLWSCEAEVEFRLLNQIENVPVFSMGAGVADKYKSGKCNSWG